MRLKMRAGDEEEADDADKDEAEDEKEAEDDMCKGDADEIRKRR